MRVVFMETPDFAVPSLRQIASESFRYEVVLVVTGKDKPRRKKNAPPEPTPVKQTAIELGLPVYETDDPADPSFIAAVAACRPDVIVVAAFRILPPEVYTLARLGAFNLHASLLPAYRGAAPVNWAIINGEKVTGVTTFFLQEKVDTGNMILSGEVAIADEDNATTLSGKLSREGALIVSETLRRISEDRAEVRCQDDRLASRAPKLTRENTRIRWDAPATVICNFIRGLAMRPSAWTMLGGKTLKIFRAVPSGLFPALPEPCGPGSVLVRDGKLLVVVLDGWIEVRQLQLEGKRMMDAPEFLRGFRPEEYPEPLVLA